MHAKRFALDPRAIANRTNTMRRIGRAFFEPVAARTRAALDRAWARLPEEYRSSNQFLGRQYAGCGALIGAMPRCDFACKGCYLGADANSVPALSLDALEDQLRQIRAWLGESGNLQLTDGELTLRQPDELVEIVQRAKRVGLVPMLMTHGDRLLRDPALLMRLVREGGLSEISIHIDTTQRGRRDHRYRHPRSECDLDPLRSEFAELIHRVRAETARPLEAATTVTVTRENLPELGGIVRWLLGHTDAFKMISFQPVARVGRTLDRVASHVEASEVWEQIEKGLAGAWSGDRPATAHRGWLGHPDCSHFVQGLVFDDGESSPRFEPLFDPNDARESECVQALLDRFGGLSFRLDEPAEVAARVAGLLIRYPMFLLTRLVPQLWRSTRRLAPEGRLRMLYRILTGTLRVRYLNIVSHHFMSAAELATERGQERLHLCAFQVPIDGALRSMCEVNALGLRDELYTQMRTERSRSSELVIAR